MKHDHLDIVNIRPHYHINDIWVVTLELPSGHSTSVWVGKEDIDRLEVK